MIPSIVTTIILLKRRNAMEVVPPRLRKIWNDWELRGLVLYSLLLQLLLILLGNRRRYIPKLWIRVIVWCAYLLADTVATLGLGNISRDLGNICERGGVADLSNEIIAFWAPFLLLHLGGPDTITAYSLEDAKLWLRRLFELLNQTAVTVYICSMAWSGSHLSILTILIFFAGLIKYGERTWNLWKASTVELRKDPTFVELMEEYSRRPRSRAERNPWDTIRELVEEHTRRRIPEGYPPEMQQMMDAIENEEPFSNHKRIVEAHYFLQNSKALFTDLPLSNERAKHSRSLFRQMSDEEAFDVIAIELGFMYDLLYTKAQVIYTPWGLAGRFITLSLTSTVLVMFCYGDKNKYYNKVDIFITFLLLAVAIFLELYAAVVLLFSDRTKLWLIKHGKTTVLKPVHCLKPLFQLPSWSGLIGQYTLLDFCVKEYPAFKLLGKYRYVAYSKVTEELRSLISSYIIKNLDQDLDAEDSTFRVSLTRRLRNIHQKYGQQTRLSLNWTTDAEFHNSIFLWHIATELCYYKDDQIGNNHESKSLSQIISRYLAFLLIFYPSMLPIGIGYVEMPDIEDQAWIIFKDIGPEAMLFFKSRGWVPSGTNEMIRRSACNMLLRRQNYYGPHIVKGNRSSSYLLSEGCRLSLELNSLLDSNTKWEFIKDIWMEMLAYAAAHSKGSNHAQQLRRGGELLSHVWLLFTHFGMTEHVESFSASST